MRAWMLVVALFPGALAIACGSGKSNGFEDVGDGGPGSSDGGPILGDGGAFGDGGPALGPPVPRADFPCDGCIPFPGMDAPACPAATLGPATVHYPPDGVLLPPNLNLFEVHFQELAGAQVYELDFTNGATEIRVETRCTRSPNGRGGASSGCTPAIPLQAWKDIAETNRDGDPVKLTVRATPDGKCVSTSAPRTVKIAKEDITGGIYYWQSAVFGGAAGKTGGIYAHDFGSLDPQPTPFYTSGTNGTCVGCHSLSRDGARMSVGIDDPDSDDGFDDVSTIVLDTKSRTVTGQDLPPGFQTWAHDHSRLVTSSFQDFVPFFGTPTDEHLEVYDGQGANHLTSMALGASGFKGTQPDLSADDRKLVFVAPKPSTIDGMIGDHHFHASAIWTATFDPTANAMGAPQALLTPTGDEAYYYPSFSPDGRFLVMNHAPSGDVFYNKNARVMLLPAGGGQPIDLPNLNQGDGLTNSWPRWSPVVQTYKGHKLVWITFSSSRNFGLRLENGAFQHCYPAECPAEDAPQMDDQIQSLDGCEQPQIWMAAVDLEDGTTGDRSYPAFWLPFQDIGSHNHSAQWVQTVVGSPQATCGNVTCAADTLCCAPGNCQPVCVK